MNFRSGTLERSVKRWGPKTSFRRPKFQRVNHGWKYVTLENQTMTRDGTADTDIIIADFEDWEQSAVSAIGVKNMTVDLVCTVAWTPASNAQSVFHNASLRWGLFCLDTDDTVDQLDDTFATHRALRWGSFMCNFQGMTLGTPVWHMMNTTRFAFRVRAKQRYMKFEDQLRLKVQNSTDLTDVMGDQRLHIFGRVSWEQP